MLILIVDYQINGLRINQAQQLVQFVRRRRVENKGRKRKKVGGGENRVRPTGRRSLKGAQRQKGNTASLLQGRVKSSLCPTDKAHHFLLRHTEICKGVSSATCDHKSSVLPQNVHPPKQADDKYNEKLLTVHEDLSVQAN